MALSQVFLSAALFVTVGYAFRVTHQGGNASIEPQQKSADEFSRQYPRCSDTLAASNLQLKDLFVGKQQVADLFAAPGQCSWWESHDCASAYSKQVLQEYFLRMTLVGQPDPRGDTLYTPPAQKAVIDTMRALGTEQLKSDQSYPDLDFMTKVFEGINVEDTGSFTVSVINAFASVFNRGSNDKVYRTKDVETKPYSLSEWGDDMERKIAEFNTLTYHDSSGGTMKALELSKWPLIGKTSFVYKLPPQGIQHELKQILHAFTKSMATVDSKDADLTVVFELAERWIRDFVILHPFIDANGRTARVALNLLLLLNGLSPNVMARQDEDMTSSPAELRDRICEGMAYAKGLLQDGPALHRRLFGADGQPVSSEEVVSLKSSCCEAAYSLEDGKEMCVSVPETLPCEKYSKLTQSRRYLPWKNSTVCAAHQNPGPCPKKKSGGIFDWW